MIFEGVDAGICWFWTDAVVVFEQAKTGLVFWFADLDFDFDVDIFGFLRLDPVRFLSEAWSVGFWLGLLPASFGSGANSGWTQDFLRLGLTLRRARLLLNKF